MISRPTLIAALVVVELAILGAAANALGAGRFAAPPAFSFAPLGSPGGAPTPARLDRTFLTGGSPRIVVDVADVDVVVEAGSAPTVHVVETVAVHGFMTGKLGALEAVQAPDGVHITGGTYDDFHVRLGLLERTLHLTVPPGARIEMATAGDIDVSGLHEKLVAHTRSGHVRIRDHVGDLDVSTNDGRTELFNVHGTALDIIDHDGRIYLTDVGADRLVAHSDYGRIVGSGVRAVDGGFTTADGRIEVSFTPSSSTIAEVHSHGGRISISGYPTVDNGEDARTVTVGQGRGHFELSTGSDDHITITQGANE